MKIFCIGDSLTEGDYGIKGKCGIANVKKINYPFFLQQLTGYDVFNFGKCGYNATSYLDFINNGGITEKNADIIIIMLGTNGGMELNPKSQGYFNYIKIIDFFKENEPNAKIILCTPPYASMNAEYSNSGYLPQIEKATKCIRLIAKEQNLNLIDIFSYNEICEENVSKYQSADGLHFNEEGYRLLTEFILSELNKIL